MLFTCVSATISAKMTPEKPTEQVACWGAKCLPNTHVREPGIVRVVSTYNPSVAFQENGDKHNFLSVPSVRRLRVYLIQHTGLYPRDLASF
jgi:hypothetical protein